MLMHYGSDEDAIKLNNLPLANLPLALASGSQSNQKSALAEWFG
jgi:hypothetical protein